MISIHEVRVFDFVSKSGAWVTTQEIAAGAGVAPRTARAHALRFVEAGIFEQAEVFPGNRYRVSAPAGNGRATISPGSR